MPHDFDVIILGGGAAGLMCAIEAGKRRRRVAVLERNGRIGKKILISGGGRCNFTNIHCRPENFISANPHFAKSALAAYTPQDFISLVEKHGIRYHEKTLGQLFCDASAGEIVDMLETECRQAGVSILTNIAVDGVDAVDALEHGHAKRFTIRAGREEFVTPALVVATGGLSIPKIGATSFGYDLARQFGLKIVATRPALVPLVFNDEDRERYCDLSGVSAEVTASVDRQTAPGRESRAIWGPHSTPGRENRAVWGPRFREKMLITHRGLSGPAILQISSYWNTSGAIHIDLAPDHDLTAPLRNDSHRDLPTLKSAFRSVLPQRLADRWLDLNSPQGWTNHALAEIEHRAHHWAITPAGTEGYAKAEVTAGGVDTNELSSKTMESRKVPGLYFIGEVVDVTGHLGGFNFQWAWASGFCAGQSV